MNEEIYFSIVIPVFNAEKYLNDTIKSVLNQTFGKWELILINDGSTDSSKEICDSYKDRRIKVYHTENCGQIIARKNGIKRAKGRYTLVLDADDSLVDDCLEQVYMVLLKKEYDMVVFSYFECDEDLKNRKQCIFDIEKTDFDSIETIKYIILNWNHQLWNKIIRTDVIQKAIECTIDKKVKVNGDYAMVIPITCEVNDVFFLNHPLYLYRIYNDSISHNVGIQHIVDTDFVTVNILSVLEQNGICDSEVRKIVMIAYLKMVLMFIRQILRGFRYSNELLISVSKLELYNESKKYDIFLSIKQFIFVKLLRMAVRISIKYANRS